MRCQFGLDQKWEKKSIVLPCLWRIQLRITLDHDKTICDIIQVIHSFLNLNIMDEKAPYSMSEEHIPKEPPPNYDEAMAATSGGKKNNM